MPQKRCGLGFDCGSMMLQPGIDPGDCENYKVCGAAIKLSPEEEFELIRLRQERMERYREVMQVDRHLCASMMLMSRGAPQTPESLGLVESLNQIATKLTELQSQLNQFEGQYVAPEKCEVHTYNVKRFGQTYEYNKLTAAEPIFAPSEKLENVKVIHLSRDHDPRNLEGRAGVDRRNKLTQARTQMNVALQALTLAGRLLESSSLQINSEARTQIPPAPIEDPSQIEVAETVQQPATWEQNVDLFLGEVDWNE